MLDRWAFGMSQINGNGTPGSVPTDSDLENPSRKAVEEDVVAEGMGNVKLEGQDRSQEKRARPSLLTQQAPPDVRAGPIPISLSHPKDNTTRSVSSSMNVDSLTGSHGNRDASVEERRYGEGFGYGFTVDQDLNQNGGPGNERITVKIADLGNGVCSSPFPPNPLFFPMHRSDKYSYVDGTSFHG